MTCTGVAVVSFFVYLQVVRRHPVMSTVIRSSSGHMPSASRPAGHNLRIESVPLCPNARLRLECRLPCGAPTDA
ncbi:hypothetical protein LF1_57270 [Rubripirellula obstinata]|uniref:Uncharacterized protein n=1 Tax=Rubripirellula obstinata TaxID=406547 RepID=A0A5B1C9U2_9BACT|nr:hypothetical protein LF1_57270 [Rubripirellula obstinata]